MRPITFKEATKLLRGTILYHRDLKNHDRTPARYRVNGNVKLWKRTPGRIQVPLARGLYEHRYLTEDDIKFEVFSLEGGD